MALAVHLSVFEGPLDLLLHLIREARLDIYDIPIAEVTSQYLETLAVMEALDLEVAGEFLVMAATLMEIKSRMLLPRPPAPPPDEAEEGEDPRAELVQRLLEYEQYKQAAERFREMEEEGRLRFTRSAEPEEGESVPLDALGPADLLGALRRMLSTFAEAGPPVASLHRERINLRLRMRELWGRLQDSDGPLSFRSLFADGPRPSRIEVIVSFLAVLELLRLGRIVVRQSQALADLILSRREPAEEVLATR
jgi:segregation and condensation protein A